jgi:hypothetical protein
VIAIVISAVLICAGSLLVGQGVCRLAGFQRFTWIAPATGFSLLMLISAAALHLPGRSSTTAVVCLLLAIGGGVLMVRRACQRPSAGGIAIGIPALLASLIPFAANGRGGTLGWGFYNDMSVHLLWADAYRSKAIAAINPLPAAYPLGPHALVATVAQGLGIGVDDAFTAMQVAVVVITAWTTLAVLGRLRWWGRVVVATITANVFLLASYFGEGAFKETIEALLVLAFALALRELIASRRWSALSLLPLALILGASLATYSYTGLIWPAATVAVLAVGVAVHAAVHWPATERLVRSRSGDAWRLLLPLGVGVLVLLVVLIPELPRLAHFFRQTTSGGTIAAIPKNDLGNLPEKLSGWEVLGIWENPDFRFLPTNQLHQGLWTAASLVAVVFGLLWWLWRRDFVLPAAVIAGLGVYLVANRNQSPYVIAKALVILSPMLVLLAGRALLDRDSPPRRSREGWVASLALGALLLVGAAQASYQALRFSVVGSKAHAQELASFRPLLAGKRVLYLAADDFIDWELPEARVSSPWGGTGPAHTAPSTARIRLRPQKPWRWGQNYDFDSVEPASYDEVEYVIAPRDGRLSSPPANLLLVRQTRDFNLFRRVGPTPRRRILDEGTEPGAVLRCGTPGGRRISRTPGVAAVREPPIAIPLPALTPGAGYAGTLALAAGRWQLTMPYASGQPITLMIQGRRYELPPSLDRLGAGWPAGEVVLRSQAKVPFSLTVKNTPITGLNQPVYANALVATRARADTVIPLRAACGRYVDWYLPGR